MSGTYFLVTSFHPSSLRCPLRGLVPRGDSLGTRLDSRSQMFSMSLKPQHITKNTVILLQMTKCHIGTKFSVSDPCDEASNNLQHNLVNKRKLVRNFQRKTSCNTSFQTNSFYFPWLYHRSHNSLFSCFLCVSGTDLLRQFSLPIHINLYNYKQHDLPRRANVQTFTQLVLPCSHLPCILEYHNSFGFLLPLWLFLNKTRSFKTMQKEILESNDNYK